MESPDRQRRFERDGLALELNHALLSWWEKHGRRDPLQKPWMSAATRIWPQLDDVLDPYGISSASAFKIRILLESLTVHLS